ncbi:MAG: tetraacyldisaccharide 4'-kinase [Stellaceae bacterium]
MRVTPHFWAEPPGFLAHLLSPIAMGWDAAGRCREALSQPYKAPAPVLCVGNLVVGGAGKTPVALALAAHLNQHGAAVHVVTRGYGGRLSGPVRVDPLLHVATDVGDEALLLACRAPCWIARERSAGVRAAIAAGAQTVLLDDGFQNPTVAKTLSLVVVDAAYGFGNGRVIPAGPLRESLSRGLARADAVVLIGGESATPRLRIADIPVLTATLDPIAGERMAGSRVLAFAGIGRPEKFFETLRAVGAVLVATRKFPDHHPFQVEEVEDMRRDAQRAQAYLVTTAKDFVRVPAASRAGIEILEVEIRWSDPVALAGLIKPVVLSAQGHGRDPIEALR